MKIGIVTQPLLANYGGILQNYALQQILKRMGHEPVTIDYIPKLPIYRYLLSCVKTLALFFIPGKRRSFVPYPKYQRNTFITPFVDRYISKTRTVHKYSSSLISKYSIEMVISGSDQVWRPMYNFYLEDMFLHFVQTDVRKIAYAASFGVDNWEYTGKQTRCCSQLAKRFDAISVREDSGVSLCRRYLNVNAVEVLDPTLLLDREDYEVVCTEMPVCTDAFLASYVLDMTPEKNAFIHKLAMERGLSVRIFSADREATLSIEEWLSMFRDASYIVTDSFHGTVLSIIFNKPFISIGNKERGYSRFQSLLGKFDLQNRLLTVDEFDRIVNDEIKWDEVNDLRKDWQKCSIDFLTLKK